MGNVRNNTSNRLLKTINPKTTNYYRQSPILQIKGNFALNDFHKKYPGLLPSSWGTSCQVHFFTSLSTEYLNQPSKDMLLRSFCWWQCHTLGSRGFMTQPRNIATKRTPPYKGANSFNPNSIEKPPRKHISLAQLLKAKRGTRLL